MIKKWIILIIISIVFLGSFSIPHWKNEIMNNCKHDYIGNVISVYNEEIKFGITEANYIENDEEDNSYIIITATIDKNNIESEYNYRDINLGYKYRNEYDEIEYKEFYKYGYNISMPLSVEDWVMWIHNNDINHKELIISQKLDYNIENIESFVIRFIENSYLGNEEGKDIEIPIDKVKKYNDINTFNKEKFNEYYNKIDKNYNRNQLFNTKLKEFNLDGYDFIGKVEIKNVSDYDFNNLRVLINPIQNTGYGYIGETVSKFDRENGYLSLKSGESKILSFKVSINEATKYLDDTKKFYQNSSLKSDENIIISIGITAMANDENLIFPDKSIGTYMYYFKDKLKVKEKIRNKEEREEFESDLKKIDYNIEKNEFEKAKEILNNYFNESAEVEAKIQEYLNKIDEAEKKYNSEFSIFRPNRRLTEDEALELAYYRVGDRLSDNYHYSEYQGRECLNVIYLYRENGIDIIRVDLNTGEVIIEDLGWQKYTKTKEELEIGTGYGWEYVE